MATAGSKVDTIFQKQTKWQQEFVELRKILGKTVLEETIKWGQACYTLNEHNVVIIHGFKEYCALLFFKGVLMKDDKKMLIQQTESVQAARQLRFTSAAEIVKKSRTILDYIKEAIRVEKAGEKIQYKQTAEFEVPDEFKVILAKKPAVKKAFSQLTPGRQRAYLMFFSKAKQAATRKARIEKYLPAILSGKGMDD